MRRSMRVLSRVAIWRAVATERDATRLARSQMDPVAADLHALLAFPSLRLLDGRDRVEMRAASVRHQHEPIS
jgi:hypothetical protein